MLWIVNLVKLKFWRFDFVSNQKTVNPLEVNLTKNNVGAIGGILGLVGVENPAHELDSFVCVHLCPSSFGNRKLTKPQRASSQVIGLEMLIPAPESIRVIDCHLQRTLSRCQCL